MSNLNLRDERLWWKRPSVVLIVLALLLWGGFFLLQKQQSPQVVAAPQSVQTDKVILDRLTAIEGRLAAIEKCACKKKVTAPAKVKKPVQKASKPKPAPVVVVPPKVETKKPFVMPSAVPPKVECCERPK